MKKSILLFFLIVLSSTVFCQDVIINGVNKNRLLTWDDFTGKPNRSSSFEANTYWNINYRYGVSFKGDIVEITGLTVKLDLDEKLSWVKENKQTPSLLKHEQGHFNIGLICQNEIIKQLSTTVFYKADYRDKIQALFNTILNKYIQMGSTYDEETDHSKNEETQEKWNNFFTKELNSRSISF